MIVNWDPLWRFLRRPILGRLIFVTASTLFSALLALIAMCIGSFFSPPLPIWKWEFATGVFAVMGFAYGAVYFVFRR
jgi:hypothetical protein